MADCNHNFTVFNEITFNGEWKFRKNSTKAANIKPSSYTVVQVTDCNFDCFQTTTNIFHQIHVQWQVWIMRKFPPIHVYYVHLTLLLIAAFQDGQTEGVKSSKQLGFLYFTYINLCLILNFFCSTGKENALNIQRF